MSARRSFFVKSFGCQMNVYDSERMGELLEANGYAAAASADAADLVVLNTCHIREKASEKVYSEIGRLKPDGKGPLVAVAGCVAQAEGAEIMRRSRSVDIVVGPQAYHRLPELVSRAAERPVATDLPTLEKFKVLGDRTKPAQPSSFLTIQEGCDKFCTYCVVPYTRGAEVSRPAMAVLAEARRLAGAGARELVLIGQNVNAYNDGTVGFAELLGQVAAIDGIARVRYTTSHPADMSDALITAHGKIAELMPYLHLPVQSGSDAMLKAMNRSHTTASYLDTLARLRRVRPDIAISGDFIVGFPGETEADFEATLALVTEVRYAQAYSFKYSARPGTPAADMDGQIDEATKADRLARLQALINQQQYEFNSASIGTTVDVLLERPGRRPGQLLGKTPWLQSVHVDAGSATVGDIVAVVIDSAGPNSLAGRIERKAA
jgi:tRNA-2-methylthio-N6-dimethylallyladenosine synthase